MGLFSIDGPLARYLNVLADLVILNIFTVVLLTPFFCLLLLLSGFIVIKVSEQICRRQPVPLGCAYKHRHPQERA